MPIYTYKIIETGKMIEVFQNMNDEPLKTYKGKKVKKVPSACSFNLKGTGFYKNDY